MPMNPNFLCCIGAELKNSTQQTTRMSQVYLYRAFEDDTLSDMLSAGFFNAAMGIIRQDDLLLLYSPNETTAKYTYARVSSVSSSGVVIERVGIEATSISVDTTGYSNISGDNLQEIINSIDSEFSKYVKLDGTSIMTGPLKMRAGSMQGAIAAYWDGVGFFKLNSNDSVTLLASMEATDGLCPATNNTYNIGKTNYKWKDAYIARVITAVINNGYDIAVPVTNGPDTLALKSEVDTAANSGRMITDQGVWFAKMYAATIPPAADDGTNYADFSQTDGDGNPIIVIYERQSGAWVQSETVIPPANYDGYVPVTKKIWDIVEQTGQNGGRVLWNHQSKEFTPYPSVVSFENIEVTGESTVDMPLNPVPQQITNADYVNSQIAASAATKANVDMDNLTSVGKNIANWSSNVTNCITEIPQDIKLELSSGTLTLKAGSKCYLKTDTTTPSVNIASDLTTTQTTNGTYFAIYNGSALTTVLTTTYNYSSLPNTYSLPLAIITVSGGTITSIDQVFNGFGYIGSTVFALPGVKGLVPDGRNADGTLKSIEAHTENVLTFTNPDSTDKTFSFMSPVSGVWTEINYKTINSLVAGSSSYEWFYNKETNFWSYYGDTSYNWVDFVSATPDYSSPYNISKFIPKRVYQAIDADVPGAVVYKAVGTFLSGGGDSLSGAGCAVVVLYPNGQAVIHFDLKVSTAGTSSSNFTYGISRNALHNLNNKIPLIRPTGGVGTYYNSSGQVSDSLNQYGGNFTKSGDSFWAPGRVYDTAGSTGGWPCSQFPAGVRIVGTLYGTY